MSTVATPGDDNTHLGGNDHHAAGDHGHPEHLAHHFDTPAQQFSTGKLGMWTFLATEVLMFGGLFCAYAVYRSNHPEVYLYAHRALDAKWGMINTIVLLASSFTMAWGVRAAQLNQKGLLQIMLALTFLGGVGFMCIKAIEYEAKWKHHLFPGQLNAFNPSFGPQGQNAADLKQAAITYIESHGHGAGHEAAEAEHGGAAAPAGEGASHEKTTPEGVKATEPNMSAAEGINMPNATMSPTATASSKPSPMSAVHETTGEKTSAGFPAGTGVEPSTTAMREFRTGFSDGNAGTADSALITPPAFGRAGTNLAADEKITHKYKSFSELAPDDRQEVNAFFSIYFMMTGLHGVHVLVGMGLLAWLFVRASRGEFSEAYFTPVDLGGLYWHLVDLIWIFLFPLLYLIH